MAPLAFILSYPDLRFPAPWTRGHRALPWKPLTRDDLAAQLDRLVRAGRPTVRVSDILAALSGHRPLPPHAVALTFDGGLAAHHDMVLPLLQDRGLVASFLVPARPIMSGRMSDRHKLQAVLSSADSTRDVLHALCDLVAEHQPGLSGWRCGPSLLLDPTPDARTRNAHDLALIGRLLRSGLSAQARGQAIDRLFQTFAGIRENTLAAQYYLNPTRIAALFRAGMEIGGHGFDAVNLQGLPSAAQENEIAETARFLREILALPGDLILSYPQGGWDEATLGHLPRHGFSGALTLHPAPVLSDSDRYRLPRIDIDAAMADSLPL